MYKVIICDDEINILKGIKKLINWEKAGLEVAALCSDGKEGYKKALEHNVDIVITDIEMPQLNGLEMMEKLRAKKTNIKFILISSYSEFKYAKKGIELGAYGYVLKPINKAEMELMLDDIKSLCDKEKSYLNMSNKIKNMNTQLINYTMKALVSDSEVSESDVTNTFTDLDFEFNNVCFSCLRIMFLNMGSDVFLSNYESFVSWIMEISNNIVSPVIFSCSSNQVVVFLTFSKEIKSDFIKETCNLILKKFESSEVSDLVIGLSDIYTKFSSLPDAYNTASLSALLCFVKGEKILLNSEIKDESKHKDIIISGKEAESINEAVKSFNKTRLIALVEQTCHTAIENNLTITELHSYYIGILLMIQKHIWDANNMLDSILNNKKYLDSISKIDSFQEWKEWIIQLINILIANYEYENISDNKKGTFESIKNYVDQNYCSNISLDILSGKFYVSPYYISHLFKNKINITYSNYIKNLRIEKAKDLLKNSNLYIYEICEKVGYQDTKYFSKVFEKETSLRPSEYRLNSSQNNV